MLKSGKQQRRPQLLTGRLKSTSLPATFRARPPVQIPAKAVGSWVPKLTQKAFEKHGFATAALLTDWAQIAGPDVARYTAPERLKWPRGVETYGEVETNAAGRPGATLVLKVDPARALDIQYKAAQLIERINVYFGYKAVTDLRILQTPIEDPQANSGPCLPRKAAEVTQPQSSELDGITDDGLRSALARLKAGITSRNRG